MLDKLGCNRIGAAIVDNDYFHVGISLSNGTAHCIQQEFGLAKVRYDDRCFRFHGDHPGRESRDDRRLKIPGLASASGLKVPASPTAQVCTSSSAIVSTSLSAPYWLLYCLLNNL